MLDLKARKNNCTTEGPLFYGEADKTWGQTEDKTWGQTGRTPVFFAPMGSKKNW